MNNDVIESAIKRGENLANKINLAKTTAQLDILYKEVENYTNFIDNEFGIIDDFSEKNEKYCELSFYAYMAVNEKNDNLEYYNVHPEEMASGVEDFLDYLKSMKWLAWNIDANFIRDDIFHHAIFLAYDKFAPLSSLASIGEGRPDSKNSRPHQISSLLLPLHRTPRQ